MLMSFMSVLSFTLFKTNVDKIRTISKLSVRKSSCRDLIFCKTTLFLKTIYNLISTILQDHVAISV